MGKLTLLEMVQNILSDMDSDEVNSISDTVESLQVAQIVQDTYYNIMAETFFPMESGRVYLTAASDTDTPTHFTIPDNTENIEFIKYDVTDSSQLKYQDMIYLEPKDFLDLVMARDSTASNVQTVTDGTGTKLLIINDRAPQYWTSFDDETVILDAFNSSVENTLQSSKMICVTEKGATFTLSDTYIPQNLPSKAFSYFLAEAKSLAFVNLKQQGNPKVEQLAKRLRTRLFQDKARAGSTFHYPDYGRR